MPRYLSHCRHEQFFAGRNFRPWRCARRMWKRDQIEVVTGPRDLIGPPNHRFETRAVDELNNGEAAYRHDQPGPQNINFLVEPGRAIEHFIWRWNTIAACRALPRK